MNKYNIVIGNHTGLQPITDYILYIKDWISQSNKHSEIEIIVTPKIAPNYHNFVIEPSVDISSNEDFDENFSINLVATEFITEIFPNIYSFNTFSKVKKIKHLICRLLDIFIDDNKKRTLFNDNKFRSFDKFSLKNFKNRLFKKLKRYLLTEYENELETRFKKFSNSAKYFNSIVIAMPALAKGYKKFNKNIIIAEILPNPELIRFAYSRKLNICFFSGRISGYRKYLTEQIVKNLQEDYPIFSQAYEYLNETCASQDLDKLIKIKDWFSNIHFYTNLKSKNTLNKKESKSDFYYNYLNNFNYDEKTKDYELTRTLIKLLPEKYHEVIYELPIAKDFINDKDQFSNFLLHEEDMLIKKNVLKINSENPLKELDLESFDNEDQERFKYTVFEKARNFYKNAFIEYLNDTCLPLWICPHAYNTNIYKLPVYELYIPQSEKWPYSSPLRSYRSLRHGILPLSIKKYEDSIFSEITTVWSKKFNLKIFNREFIDTKISKAISYSKDIRDNAHKKYRFYFDELNSNNNKKL